MIVQHGLQGDRSFVLTMANTFAAQGWASVAIEGVTFGARSANPSNTTILPSDVPVREPYLGLRKGMVALFASAFAGGTPVVKDFPAPRRDFDDDGVDPAPLDPAK